MRVSRARMGMCSLWWLEATQILLATSWVTVCVPSLSVYSSRQRLSRAGLSWPLPSLKPKCLLEERWQIPPSHLQNLKSGALSNTWKTTLLLSDLKGKRERDCLTPDVGSLLVKQAWAGSSPFLCLPFAKPTENTFGATLQSWQESLHFKGIIWTQNATINRLGIPRAQKWDA